MNDQELLTALKKLKIPSLKDEEDLKAYMSQYGNETADKELKLPTKTTTQISLPKISIFYGDAGKGEVSYDTWRYEINCLISEKVYSNDTILLSIRKSVRGAAADVLRRLGVGVSIENILVQFDTVYGDIESEASILKKFFSCSQNSNEKVIEYCSRLENTFARAIELKAFEKQSTDTKLKDVFYQGLIPELKHLVSFKFELTKSYNDFKLKVRRVENELADEKAKQHVTQCQATGPPRDTQVDKMNKLLQSLDERLERLEKTENAQNQYQKYNRHDYSHFRDNRGARHHRGKAGLPPSGRGQYRPERPTAGNMFRPRRCYKCNSEQHLIRDCPEN